MVTKIEKYNKWKMLKKIPEKVCIIGKYNSNFNIEQKRIKKKDLKKKIKDLLLSNKREYLIIDTEIFIITNEKQPRLEKKLYNNFSLQNKALELKNLDDEKSLSICFGYIKEEKLHLYHGLMVDLNNQTILGTGGFNSVIRNDLKAFAKEAFAIF